jgi:hypothetical protein
MSQPMSIVAMIEAEYIRACTLRDAATEPERRNAHQGAIEVLEQIMHQVRPGWSWDVCRRKGWVPDVSYEHMKAAQARTQPREVRNR